MVTGYFKRTAWAQRTLVTVLPNMCLVFGGKPFLSIWLYSLDYWRVLGTDLSGLGLYALSSACGYQFACAHVSFCLGSHRESLWHLLDLLGLSAISLGEVSGLGDISSCIIVRLCHNGPPPPPAPHLRSILGAVTKCPALHGVSIVRRIISNSSM